MSSDIIDVIAHRVLESESEWTDRLQRQAEALQSISCTTPVLGRWIDEVDSVPHLLSSFALNDEDFAARFPVMAAEVNGEARHRLLQTFDRHIKECRHCSKRLQYDLDLAQFIDETCQENRDSLLKLHKAKKGHQGGGQGSKS